MNKANGVGLLDWHHQGIHVKRDEDIGIKDESIS
jgi:hypothetical protein